MYTDVYVYMKNVLKRVYIYIYVYAEVLAATDEVGHHGCSRGNPDSAHHKDDNSHGLQKRDGHFG